MLAVPLYYDDESWVRFEYEPRGLLTRVDNNRVPVERSYDALGRMVREKQGQHLIESEYDLLGNRVRRRSSLGGKTTYRWDGNGQLEELSFGPDAHYRERDAPT